MNDLDYYLNKKIDYFSLFLITECNNFKIITSLYEK